MKKYSKPTLDVLELRVDNNLAAVGVDGGVTSWISGATINNNGATGSSDGIDSKSIGLTTYNMYSLSSTPT